MKKYIGSIMSIAIALILLGYSATRSFDFVARTLPADRQSLAYMALAALDGGLIGWLITYLFGAKGGMQRAIAFLMIIVDLVGCVVMFTLDTLLNTGEAGMTIALTPGEMQTAVLALSLIIALNIAATVGHHLADPEVREKAAEEEVESMIEDKKLEAKRQAAPALAAEIVAASTPDWVEDMRLRETNRLTGRKQARLPASTVDVPAQPIPPAQIYQAGVGTEEPEEKPEDKQDPTKRRRR